MQLVPVSPSAVGRRLARSITDPGGRVLVAAGTPLTPRLVRSLRRRGYASVYVINELAPDVMVDEVINEETRARTTAVVRETLTRCAAGRKVPVARLRSSVEEIIGDLQSSQDVVLSLSTLRSVHDYTFVHSVNVCLYSLLLGTAAGYGRSELRTLGVGAILHDVGKVAYKDLVARPGPLSPEEFEAVKGHAEEGFRLLRQNFEIELLAAQVALQHHERCDGSGYPRGLRDDEILAYAKIAAVADVYDAITADRPYRAAMPPHEALEVLRELSGAKLDGFLVRKLQERLAVYPNGTMVLLSSGELAVVVGQGPTGVSPPRVRVVTDPELILAAPVEVDLEGDRQRRAIDRVLADYPIKVREQLDAAHRAEA